MDFQHYVQRSYPRIGLPKSSGCAGKCTHVDLISYLLKEYRGVTLRAYEKIRIDIRVTGARLLRERPFGRIFPQRRKRMILRLLVIRHQALSNLIS